MYKLRFLLSRYLEPAYRWLSLAVLVGAALVAGAAFTDWLAPVAIVVGTPLAAIVALAATTGILVVNVVVADGLKRGIDHFEAAYDTYRRANAIPDPFYLELDRAEAAARAAGGGRPSPALWP